MESEHVRTSRVWKYFTRKDQFVASCNACGNDYSYRTSVSNLWKHYKNKHGKPEDYDITEASNSETSDEEQETPSPTKRKSTWKYFEVLDSNKFEAHCKLCRKEVAYDSVSDLSKHVKEHGEKILESDDEEYERKKLTRKKYSLVWQFFKILEPDSKRAVCLVCRNHLSYGATVSNLKRHLQRKHPDKHKQISNSNYNNNKEMKKIIISANGQLYEVETDTNKVENDDDDEDRKDPIEMDTVFLEDLEDSIDQTPPTPRRVSTTINKENTPQKRNFAKLAKARVITNRNSCSEDEPPRKQRASLNTTATGNLSMGSLDYFGQYVVSLLKEMPSHASSQLQNDIILLIFNKKIALESQAATKYSIAISGNHLENSNVITEPVTVTISATENNESMVVESTETVETS